MRTIDQFSGRSQLRLTGLEQCLVEEKRERMTLRSWWYGLWHSDN
jgi:hypothetical protein